MQYIVLAEQGDSRMESNTFLYTSLIPNTLFTCGGMTIYWISIKQTLVVSSSHAQIISNHEARRTWFWLWNLTQHIRQNCGLTCNRDVSTILYEDIVACITQNQGRVYQRRQHQSYITKVLFHSWSSKGVRHQYPEYPIK